ncbi:MAG: hypothetical protein C0617_13085 [Desulfuromonas sp.]|uniref:N-acetylmuramoyl-L-alanine amidase n=1 Tax=Desulfuromonas sp. TaxID=892 RepID=UPI000CA9DF7F|nr:N-acetylmuramoyl-L-alanine amidase [Desulfuromonas sp.]PLX82803.1 MAG: hypothetical protein C0617_13085 [Desulfuromonas sp.]
MVRTLILLCLALTLSVPAAASVELSLGRQKPTTIHEVYLRDGVAYLALDDLLPTLGLRGRWDSVEHVYLIKSSWGTAVISPGSQFLRQGERFVPLQRPPRFIDGRLRVSSDFITEHLAQMVERPIYFRNLHPTAPTQQEKQNPLDRLFAFLLRKKQPVSGGGLHGVAIDPGHGGQDPGVLGPLGGKEKEVTLEVARQLEKLVKMRLGIPTFLSRDGDYSLTWEKRLEPAARPEVDVLLLLHAQASLGHDPRGLSLFVRPREGLPGGGPEVGDGESMRLARHLTEALRDSGMEVAGIREAPLLPLGRGDLPTVLVELGYLSHPGDRVLLQDADGQQKLAGALFAGLKAFADELKEVSH